MFGVDAKELVFPRLDFSTQGLLEAQTLVFSNHWASWRSCTISSAWCLFCVVECGGKEGVEGNSAEYSQKSSMG